MRAKQVSLLPFSDGNNSFEITHSGYEELYSVKTQSADAIILIAEHFKGNEKNCMTNNTVDFIKEN